MRHEAGYLPVRLPTGFCFILGCGKPLVGDRGQPMGARGMCWHHYREAKNAGDLTPWVKPRASRPVRCPECDRKLTKTMRFYGGKCHACHSRDYRNAREFREEYLRKERQRNLEASRARRADPVTNDRINARRRELRRNKRELATAA